MKKIYLVILLLLPLLLLFTALYLNNNRGPYWLGNNLDPEYVYLLNASNLAQMKGVGHVDHPGTPVQILGALTIRTVHAFKTTENDLKTDIIQNPEYYLAAINGVMIALNVLLLFILGIIAIKTTGNIWLSLLLQAAPFLSITLLQFGLTRMTPEPLLFVASSLMVLLILIFTGYANENKKNKMALVILFALVTGFGIAVKITFIPMAIIPIFALQGMKKKIQYAAAMVLGFVVSTLPIIRMYPRLFSWIYNLSTHSGQYGSGASRITSSDVYLKNIKALLSANPFFSITLMGVILVLVIVMILPKTRRKSIRDIYFKFLMGTAAAQLFGLLMVSKHSANHYLLPELNLSGIMMVLLYLLLRNITDGGFLLNNTVGKNSSGEDKNKKLFPVMLPVLFGVYFLAMLIWINPPSQIISRGTGLNGLKEKCMELNKTVQENYKGYAKVYFYRSSSPQYALKFGNDISRSYHSEILDKTYRDVYFYDIWNKTFSRFHFDHTFRFKKIRDLYGDKIIFQGTPVEIKGIRQVITRDIIKDEQSETPGENAEKTIRVVKLVKVHNAGRHEAAYIIKYIRNKNITKNTDN